MTEGKPEDHAPTTTAMADLPEEARLMLSEVPLQRVVVDRLSHPTAAVPERHISSSVPAEGAGGEDRN